MKGCGKKMRAFKRIGGWKYMCEDEAKHAQDKLKARQKGPEKGKGGVKKGTPSPRMGRQFPQEPRRKWYWGKEKDPRKNK